MRRFPRSAGAIGFAAAALLAAGCDTLDVPNPNEPDAIRALSDPGTVQSVASGAFNTFFNTMEGMPGTGALVTMADAYSASWNNFQMRLHSSEPRTSWQNSAAAAAKVNVEWHWYGYYSALSSANDVLTAIKKNNIVIENAANTKMVETGARLMQGMTLGELSLLYDKALIVDENSNLASLDFSTRQQVRDTAVKLLAMAAALAKANTFTAPTDWTNGTAYTNVQVEKIANTLAARVLAYHARAASEMNDAATWTKVVQLASAGISSGARFDLQFTGDGQCPDQPAAVYGWCDELKEWSQDPTTMRVDTRLAKMLDPATQVDPYPAGGNPHPNSPDKRLGDGSFGDAEFAEAIGGYEATANAGTDFAWSGDEIFIPVRGMYHQSNITHVRYVYAGFSDPAGTGGARGRMPVVTATENDLLWAEGLIRSGGSLSQAADLINLTRVGRGGLPPATAADGVNGLLDKLAYEQMVELLGLGYTPYFIRRRLPDYNTTTHTGMGLQPLTPHHMPVPAKELDVLGKPLYTFGGTFPLF